MKRIAVAIMAVVLAFGMGVAATSAGPGEHEPGPVAEG